MRLLTAKYIVGMTHFNPRPKELVPISLEAILRNLEVDSFKQLMQKYAISNQQVSKGLLGL